jgi:hypothetical protein
VAIVPHARGDTLSVKRVAVLDRLR